MHPASQILIDLFVLMMPQAPAHPPEQTPDLAIDASVRNQVIEGALAALNESYVFPELAKSMAVAIHERQSKKEYDAITSASAFADKLTADLQAVAHDKHLRVRYRAEVIEPPPSGEQQGTPSPEAVAGFKKREARSNFGFVKLERLEGNVGYLDFRRFAPPAIAGETASAAMNFLADTDALIVDLRKNGGGDPAMVAMLCSYFFGVEPVHLNDIYFRPDDSTQQFWTSPFVPGRKYLDKDVYVLTSSYTFSGAEEFANNLKTLKRATIVGETTGGGANPGGTERLNDHFLIFVPSGRAINPITKSNWDGTGVEPDVKVSAEYALQKAHALALDKLMTTGSDSELAEERKQTLQRLQTELAAAKLKNV